jgi:hypothetical protein
MSQSLQEIQEQVDQDTLVLFKTTTLFPFEIFPTDVVVYRTKVDIIDRIFFWAQEVRTVMVPDIFTLEIQTTPFFSSVTITHRQPMTPLITIKFLRNKEALQLRALVQGLVTAHYQKLDLSQLSPAQLVQELKELGEVTLPKY